MSVLWRTQFAQDPNIHVNIYQRQKLTLMILFYGWIILLILGDISMFMVIPNFSSMKQNAKVLQNDSSAPVLYRVFLVAHQKENHQGCNI